MNKMIANSSDNSIAEEIILPLPQWQETLNYSNFLRRVLSEQRIQLLQQSWQQAIDQELLNKWFEFYLANAEVEESTLKRVLRQLRQTAIAHITLRDLSKIADLTEVVHSMTLLADYTTNLALSYSQQSLEKTYGCPLDSQGLPQKLLIVGMGKLGGGELNVSSDVDYIFIYPESGETDGKKKIDNFEFFSRLGKKIIALLDEITADGQVFRVDMRLRPNGDSGPLVCGLDALETYLITQGREWERYAWIKGRVMNSGSNLQPEWRDSLYAIVKPFIYRKYLDFGTIEAMRDLHAQIRREVMRKDRINHIKLGYGGIREIEFIAQVFQLIRGGRQSNLQIRPTLQVLQILGVLQQLTSEQVNILSAAYVFFRNIEHRLQYVDDQQTHLLPDEPQQIQLLAQMMGYSQSASFMQQLTTYRDYVAEQFAGIFSAPESSEDKLVGLWLGQDDNDLAITTLNQLGYQDCQQVLAQIKGISQSPRFAQLPDSARQRLNSIAPKYLEIAAKTSNPDAASQRGLVFFETISRRSAYFALLQQYPQALHKLADIMAESSWAADYLNLHPLLLDELLNSQFDEITNKAVFRSALDEILLSQLGDTEREMDVLREYHHAQVFRLLVADLSGKIKLEHISDHLSDLAEVILEKTLTLCWQKIARRHSDLPLFVIIGYGKLGGKELGYGSDLDLVFLYDDEHSDAGTNYARLAQRITTWLGSTTSAGILFETDTRLRPNGDAGLIASSLDGFKSYMLENAWLWELQALTRARACAGDRLLAEKFEAIRREILAQARNNEEVKQEIVAMREKMRENLASSAEEIAAGKFDLKHDVGGIVDVEFIVQYLILVNAHRYPQLLDNLGNIALLGISAKLSLINKYLAEQCQIAYRNYRQAQHLRRLNPHQQSSLQQNKFIEQINAVKNLWAEVFLN